MAPEFFDIQKLPCGGALARRCTQDAMRQFGPRGVLTLQVEMGTWSVCSSVNARQNSNSGQGPVRRMNEEDSCEWCRWIHRRAHGKTAESRGELGSRSGPEAPRVYSPSIR